MARRSHKDMFTQELAASGITYESLLADSGPAPEGTLPETPAYYRWLRNVLAERKRGAITEGMEQ